MICFKNFYAVRQAFRVILFAALCISTSVMSAQEEKVSLNFVNADIEEVIRAVSQITGKNFVVDPRVKGTINIISSTPVAAPLAYDILLSTLRMQGFAAVEAGGVTKILPEADAKLYVSGVHGSNNGEKLVTRVFVLQYESAAQLVPVLRPLIPPNNIVVAYPGSNTLVVTDYASNVKRIAQIVESIDRPSKAVPIIIPVKLASAVEIAQIINHLLQDSVPGAAGAADPSQRFVLLADSRTNNLLLRTENPERIERVRDLVKRLDVNTGSLGNIHVVYLKNAEAVKLAQTLRSVLSGDTSATSSSSGSASVAPGSPAVASLASSSGSSGSSSGGGIIQADAATNSLIITASSNIYNNIRAVIDMLDVRRAQVFVEALIAEVTVGKGAELGIQWQAAATDGNGTSVGGGTNFPKNNIISVGSNLLGGLPPGLGSGLNIGLVRNNNLGALASAMQTDANTNILSTPNLMMLDNEEAKIVIGSNVPFITGTQNGTTANPNPFQTIERKDVGLTLKIKPQISEGGTVKMLISQEVSSVDESTKTNSSGVTTNKRSIDTTVLVDDGQTLVLGGLIQDDVRKTEYKVPLLGDIPILGWLFRYETRNSNKTNLMVFIKPTILRSASASNGLTQDRYEYIRNQQGLTKVPWNLVLPNMTAPVSPEIKEPSASSVPATVPLSESTSSSAENTSSAKPTVAASNNADNPTDKSQDTAPAIPAATPAINGNETVPESAPVAAPAQANP
ncbi:MAG: type II secretion system secretin GspD [Gallionellaceae bacterium]|jgi:general secretion pathway protein D